MANNSTEFTTDQLERYKRNIMLTEVGLAGQRKLLQAKVLVVGAGGLGSPVLLYLAAAGVGTLGVIDGDRVDLSNLQRQIVHGQKDIGRFKAESARERLAMLNAEVQVEVYGEPLTAENGLGLLDGYDFVVEATDNFEAKFLVNDLCLQARVPFCHGGILEFTGQILTVIPYQSACYRCVFTRKPPEGIARSCSQAGVLGAVAGVIGALQAAEALKYLAGCGELLVDTLLTYDALTARFRRVEVRKRQSCRCSLAVNGSAF